MNIIFMGTPNFAVPTLEALFAQGYTIDLVVTQKDRPKGRGKKVLYTPVKEKALELGLEVYQPDSINSPESIDFLRKLSPDFMVVVAYGQILKENVLEIPKYGCYNVHASLLPKYRGAAPINWAIIDGESMTGVTIMEMEEGLDTGDIILKESIPIENEDDSLSIHDKLSELGANLIISALEKISKGDYSKVPQNHLESTYAAKLNKDLGKIDWNKSTIEIVNLIRGLKPWPSAYFIYNEEIVKVHKGKAISSNLKGKIGEIIKVNSEGIFVCAHDGIVVMEEIQFPGKRKMIVEEYLRGNSIKEGIVLV
ncbi:MAG: methionyl-tRNA formyltransferase [Tissierellaceae bacterium]|nr:methionyl-tRNA formyltransferase [Tissierellaceae bacterium]